jgi:regulator of protease activity HflC (stomatin/prohibitin superfamily)
MNASAARPPGSGAPGIVRLLQALTLGSLILSAVLAVLQSRASGQVAVSPLLVEMARARLAALPLAALLAGVAGLAGTLAVARARWRAETFAPAVTWRRRIVLSAGSLMAVRKAARWPQALLVTPLAALGIAAALLFPAGDPAAPVTQQAAWLLGGGFLVLCFPLLVAERLLAAVPPTQLPEAPWLRALAFVAVLAFAAAGVLELAAGFGLPWLAARLATLLALLPAAVAAELAGRAMGRCFLPPPPADTAHGAANSILARLLAEGAAARGLAEPMRRHLGIDFARSWALAYVRAAFAPLALLLVLLAWGLSGVAIVPLDQRAVYERFGAPVRVLPPGIHLMLPWPFGRVRAVEFGPVHELALKGVSSPDRVAAEAVPPPQADRLWEQENPAEAWFLVAAVRERQQGFQMVSADIRLFWRVGLTDADALHAAYGAVDPAGLLRQSAGRVAAAFFAARTLDESLGENREAMAGALRTNVQRDLDAAGVGLELSAVVIEALHPPGGAAGAYHAVQAAQIDADASISAERGRAFATLAEQRQAATGLLRRATAGAEETLSAARADATRFAADRDADHGGVPPYRMERRLSALQTVLTAGPLTVLDHRIPPVAVPLLDFRPPPGAGLPIEEQLR